MATFVRDLLTVAPRPDVIIAHSAKVWALLKDGAFSSVGSSTLIKPFEQPDAPKQEDKLWDKLPSKRYVSCAGDLALVNVGARHNGVLAMATPDFGVVKYDPAFRVDYLRLARLLALKQHLVRASCRATTSSSAALKLCQDLCHSTGISAAIDTARETLSRQLTVTLSIRGLSSYLQAGPVSDRLRQQRQDSSNRLAA